MKIVLVLCPSWGIETPHLGIALLVGNLRKHGYRVEVRDFNIRIHNRDKGKGLWKSEEDVHWEDEGSIRRFIQENDTQLDSFVKQILDTQAQVVGFSVYNTTQKISLELARRIKRYNKDKIIIFGAQQCFPSGAAQSLLKDEAVDIIVRGEGDEILPELMDKIENGRELDSWPGVVFKRNGMVIDGGLRAPIKNLDELPFPEFDDFSLDIYDNPQQLPILTSRGCPYPCVFCSTKLFWAKYRTMSGERIFREILHQLKKYKNVKFFTFNDHTVNADMRSLSTFCDLVIEAKSKDRPHRDRWEHLSWRGAPVIRPEMNMEFLKKLKETGCIELEYGLESGSSQVRDKMKKSMPDDLIDRVIRQTYEVGISARVNFMFGFPGETEEDFQKTLDVLRRNKEFFTEVHASETFCCIDPGTYLYNHYEEFGISNKPHSLYWESADGKNNYIERLNRHQSFCQLAISLGIRLSPGGHKILLHKEHFLNEYYRYKEKINSQ